MFNMIMFVLIACIVIYLIADRHYRNVEGYVMTGNMTGGLLGKVMQKDPPKNEQSRAVEPTPDAVKGNGMHSGKTYINEIDRAADFCSRDVGFGRESELYATSIFHKEPEQYDTSNISVSKEILDEANLIGNNNPTVDEFTEAAVRMAANKSKTQSKLRVNMKDVAVDQRAELKKPSLELYDDANSLEEARQKNSERIARNMRYAKQGNIPSFKVGMKQMEESLKEEADRATPERPNEENNLAFNFMMNGPSMEYKLGGNKLH